MKILRMTEGDLNRIIKEATKKILMESVLGDNWNVSDTDEIKDFNNKTFDDLPFEMGSGKSLANDHDWSITGDETLDPTYWDDYFNDPDAYRREEDDNYDITDSILYNNMY